MPHKEVEGFPSVTQVINVLDKPGLCMWYGKYGTAECNRIKNAAAKFGTNVHSLIEAHLQSGNGTVLIPPEEGYSKEEMACFNSFKAWYRTAGLTALSLEPEEPVISKIHGYQGTWDFIGKDITKGIIVADWKTSNQLYDTVGLQLAAYANLYGELQGWDSKTTWKNIPNGLAVRIDKESAKVYNKWYTGLNFYFDVFQSLLLPYQFAARKGAWGRERVSKSQDDE